MANVLFYTFTVLIWGSTWLAIKFQLGTVAPSVSILLFPLVALLLSTIWENYQWTTPAVVGIVMILGGNYLALRKRKPAPVANVFEEATSEN